MKKSNVKVTRTAQEKQATKKERRTRRKVKLSKIVESKVKAYTNKIVELNAGFREMRSLLLNANMELNSLKSGIKPEVTVNDTTVEV